MSILRPTYGNSTRGAYLAQRSSKLQLLIIAAVVGLLALGCGDPEPEEERNQQQENNQQNNGEQDNDGQDNADNGSCELPEDGEMVRCRDDDYEPTDAPECQCAAETVDPEEFGENCSLARLCGEQVGIDCDSAVDGPYYYVDGNTGETLERCGGYCMAADPDPGYCEECPPEDWTCETY